MNAGDALPLDVRRVALHLEAEAQTLEALTRRIAMTGQLQGETLHIASLIRELARKLAA